MVPAFRKDLTNQLRSSNEPCNSAMLHVSVVKFEIWPRSLEDAHSITLATYAKLTTLNN